MSFAVATLCNKAHFSVAVTGSACRQTSQEPQISYGKQILKASLEKRFSMIIMLLSLRNTDKACALHFELIFREPLRACRAAHQDLKFSTDIEYKVSTHMLIGRGGNCDADVGCQRARGYAKQALMSVAIPSSCSSMACNCKNQIMEGVPQGLD